ncbi:MAG TPA: hypothetical protein VHU23_03100 [Rhizomicrobium sp.]|jgi:hypothetical protein|nr:hypothetical protein [Rhizomicrobium sp.]
MKALALSVVWTIPLVFFQWLGMPWYWALFATLPVMAPPIYSTIVGLTVMAEAHAVAALKEKRSNW